MSTEQLMIDNDSSRRDFDATLVELSSVANQNYVTVNWGNTLYILYPVTKCANMEKVVTSINVFTFGAD